MVSLLKGVYKVLPEFKNVPLHIFGESYGGKMAIEFAYELDLEIKQGTIESNLVGVYLGDAWTSPIDYTLSWAPYLLNLVLLCFILFFIVESFNQFNIFPFYFRVS